MSDKWLTKEVCVIQVESSAFKLLKAVCRTAILALREKKLKIMLIYDRIYNCKQHATNSEKLQEDTDMEKTLHVNGRELTSTEFVQVPTEGKWF